MKFCDNLHGGLNKLAEVLQVERIGPQHQVLLLALCLLHSSVDWQVLAGLCFSGVHQVLWVPAKHWELYSTVFYVQICCCGCC